MDGDFVLDIQEVIENVENAQVLSVFFPTFRKSLIIDTRANEKEGPMVRIMPMVGSPQERIRSIRRIRPSFPRLRDLTVIAWPRYVNSLVNLGIWERVEKRCIETGHPESLLACQAALNELRQLEKAELAAVVLGENYHTIWAAKL